MALVHVVVGAQFGSEAKGAVTALSCRNMTSSDVNIRVAGPNAGHTVYSADGREWKLRAIPVGAVANEHCQLHIAAGSEVDVSVLVPELQALEDAGFNVASRLTIHPSATMLAPSHLRVEQEAGLVGRIGSTGKGIGAARADRIMRRASTWGEYAVMTEFPLFKGITSEPGPFDLSGVGDVVIEGTQGYGLGLHTEHYPQVTSSDCRAIDFLAMAGISPWDTQIDDFHVTLVARTFPIRVAGNSGPLKNESSWAVLGLPEERTTVTNNIRRVGDWDPDLVYEAVRANGGGDWNDSVSLAVTMLDQRFPDAAGTSSQGELPEDTIQWLQDIQGELETEISVVGTGPRSHFTVSLP